MLTLREDTCKLRWVGLLLPFSILTLIAWGFAARPDMLAVALSLGGVYLYLRAPQSWRVLCGSAGMLALAWWCKQSFVAAPAGVFLALLCAGEWRRGGVFALVYCALLAALAGGTETISHGWFYRNIVTANITRLDTAQVGWLSEYGYFYLAPFVSVAALLACLLYGKAIFTEPRLRCMALYLLAAVALNLAACMKEGAYYNYMLEPLFIACALAALSVQWLMKYKYTALLTPLLLLVSLAFSCHSYWHDDGALENALWADIGNESAHIQAVIDKMNTQKGDVLTSKSFLAVRSLKPVLATDLFNARYLEEEGIISTSALAQRLARREISAVVAPAGCQPSISVTSRCHMWPWQMQKAIVEHYAPGETVFGQVFWYPKDGRHPDPE